MGITDCSSSKLHLEATPPPLEKQLPEGTEPPAVVSSNESSADSRNWYRQALQETLELEPVEAKNGKSRSGLNTRWQITAEQIGSAFSNSQEHPPLRTLVTGEAKVIVENPAVLKQALLESRAGILQPSELPQVVRDASNGPVPRSFEIASIYLRCAGYEFAEDEFVRFLGAVQDAVPLRSAEVWYLKPFLELTLLEQIGEAISGLMLRARGGRVPPSTAIEAASLRLATLGESLLRIANLDWKVLFEEVCRVEQILDADPAGAYPCMERESRETYRAAVAELSARSRCSEPEVARRAVELARAAQNSFESDPRAQERRAHVGYYLIDAGQAALKKQIAYSPSLFTRCQADFLKWPAFFYLLGIEVATVVVLALLLMFTNVKPSDLAVLLLFAFPAMECTVATMNLLTTRMFRPRKLPTLDFSEGIPADCATLVAVPALLTSEAQMRAAVHGLEIRFLANEDPNLHFALVTDLPDSVTEFDDRDALVEPCSEMIRQLNEQYRSKKRGAFFHLHRARTYNTAEGLWMGWERKRGKLLNLNQFLLGEADHFPVKSGDVSLLKGIRYVITLDLDTQLPPSAARRLVGALAHPLNRAVINPVTNTVREGYGILQPRVDISVKSSSRSRFAALLSGDTGFDIYTRAISDVYQDLFGHGIFTGKGIYEVAIFQKVLGNRFPCNRVLSHDLIEGEYARTGLISDIAVIDDYPSHFSAFSRRKHRWVRGDWQIIFGLFSRVPNGDGEMVRNPLPQISQWKIVDNLRRSLVEFATLLLFLCGWLLLPERALYWTLGVLALMLFPTCLQFLMSVASAGKGLLQLTFWKNALSDFGVALARILVRLAFLFQQSLTDLDAVVRTLVRMRFTHRGLLEWETAADAEAASGAGSIVDFYLKCSLALSAGIAILIGALRLPSLKIALPFLVLWASSSLICEWLNRPQRSLMSRIKESDRLAVRMASLYTWRFFERFSTREENWLIPDIVQDEPWLVAHRVSPTNLGLLLNARLAAVDLGYLALADFVQQTEHTFETIRRMPRQNGHFYNWYATDTLRPVEPLFISTVDSGNLLCSLWTLKQGCLELVRQPLLWPALWDGIKDHTAALLESVTEKCSAPPEIVRDARALKQLAEESASAHGDWVKNLHAFEIDVLVVLNKITKFGLPDEVEQCSRDLLALVSSHSKMLEALMPWETAPIGEMDLPDELGDKGFAGTLTLENIPRIYQRICAHLAARIESDPASPSNQLRALLERAERMAVDLTSRITELAQSSERIAEEMDFRFLYRPKKKLFANGFKAAENCVNKDDYDLLASEARASVFCAIAKGDAPHETWFELKRSYRSYRRDNVLLSWTGTMFEYLMPALWMKAYPGTLIERGLRSAVAAQQKFGNDHAIPWGISESSCNRRNPDGHYFYYAFGVPGLAIHRDECSGDLVTTPYASFLALLVDPAAAVKNLRRMKDMGMLSSCGFFEALDFTPRRLNDDQNYAIVRNWMAHHQGMAFLAAANFLCDACMQRRFHAEPRVAASERLLHEMQPRAIPYEAEAEVSGESSSALGKLAQQIQHRGFRNLVPKLSS